MTTFVIFRGNGEGVMEMYVGKSLFQDYVLVFSIDLNMSFCRAISAKLVSKMGEIAWQFGRFCGGHKDIRFWTERHNWLDIKTKRLLTERHKVIDRKTKRLLTERQKEYVSYEFGCNLFLFRELCLYVQNLFVFLSKNILSFCQWPFCLSVQNLMSFCQKCFEGK